MSHVTTSASVMSSTPTAGRQAPNRSGRWVMQAPTSNPPLEPPLMASLGVEVIFSAISHSAQAMKSVNEFFFLRILPSSYHSRPKAEEPRMCATAYTNPRSRRLMRLDVNSGSSIEPYAPYP